MLLPDRKHRHAVIASLGPASKAIRAGKCLAAMTFFSSLRAKRGNLGYEISLILLPAHAAPPTQTRTRPCASVRVRMRPYSPARNDGVRKAG